MRPPKSASNAGETTIAIAASKGDGIATYGIAILNGQELSVCFQALPDTTPNEMNLLAAPSIASRLSCVRDITPRRTAGTCGSFAVGILHWCRMIFASPL